MNHVQKVVKNAGILLLGRLTTYVLYFLFIVYTARCLGPKDFGVLSLGIAFTGIFSIFMDIGLSLLTVREVARNKDVAGKYLGNIIIIKIILIVLTFGLITIIINLLGYPKKTIVVMYLVAISVAVSALSQIFYAIFQAFEAMEYISFGQVLNYSLLLLGSLLVVRIGSSVYRFALLLLLASLITLLYCVTICTRRFAKPKIEINLSFWKATIREALPFGLSIIFITIYYYIDVVMLSLIIPDSDKVIGWYNAAYRLTLALLVIPSVYFASIYPIMSRLYKTSENLLKFIHERSLKYMVILAFPIGILITLLAESIILLTFGPEFKPSAIALQILVWSSVFIYMSQPFGQLVRSTNRQIIETKITAAGAILNIFLNLLIIPKLSYIGASITTVITEFFVLLAYILVFFKTEYSLKREFILDTGLKVLLSCLFMIIFIKLFEKVTVLPILVISALFGYFGVFCLIKGFNRDDLEIFKNILRGLS